MGFLGDIRTSLEEPLVEAKDESFKMVRDFLKRNFKPGVYYTVASEHSPDNTFIFKILRSVDGKERHIRTMRWARAARQAWIAQEYHELPPLDGVDGAVQKRVVPYGEARTVTHRHMPESKEFFRALTCWSGDFCSDGHVKLTSPRVCTNAGPSGPDFMNDSIVAVIYYMGTVLG